MLSKVSTGTRTLARPLHPESVNDLLQAAVARAGLYTAHSLRARFVSYAYLRGAFDWAVTPHTRHRSLASVGRYVQIHQAWEDNAATMLGL